jgi:hypothetical protein
MPPHVGMHTRSGRIWLCVHNLYYYVLFTMAVRWRGRKVKANTTLDLFAYRPVTRTTRADTAVDCIVKYVDTIYVYIDNDGRGGRCVQSLFVYEPRSRVLTTFV